VHERCDGEVAVVWGFGSSGCDVRFDWLPRLITDVSLLAHDLYQGKKEVLTGSSFLGACESGTGFETRDRRSNLHPTTQHRSCCSGRVFLVGRASCARP
jgi:hypothetical protein